MTVSEKSIFFVSDLHLGIPTYEKSRERETHFIRWIDQIENEMQALYIMGDLFDFWFEHKSVVPRGYIRLLARLAALRENGIPVFFFVGNHDLWMRDYFEKELDIPVYRKERIEILGGKKFYLAHGDGLGKGDVGYKFLKKIFTNPFFQALFRLLPADFAIGLANYWSRKSRFAQGEQAAPFKGAENERLVQFANQVLEDEKIDFFIFGHRHLPLNLELKNESKYFNLGDWLHHYSYAKFDGQDVQIHYFKPST